MKNLLLIIFLFFVSNVYAQKLPSEEQYDSSRNALINPGLEQGIKGWTTTTLTAALESTVIHSGKKALKLSASASTGNTTQSVTTNVAQLAGTQGIASAFVKTSLSDVYVCAIVDSVESGCTLVVNDSKWKLVEVPFVFGSTSYGVRVKNTVSATGDIYVDDAYAGIMPAGRMPEVAQAQIAGSSYFAGTTSCTWTRTSTTIGAFGTVAACPGPTIEEQSIGSWQTTDADLPRQTVNNLPAGKYKATFFVPTFMTSATNASIAINDGTTTCQAVAANGNSASDASIPVSCIFNYSSVANRTFEIYGASTSSTLNINNATTSPNRGVKFILEYFPPTSKIYSQQCQSSLGCENEFSAKVSSTGVVSDENLDWVNGNCAVTDTSLFTCSFNSSVFSSAPTCVVGIVSSSTTGDVIAKIDTQATTTSVVARTSSTNATNDFVKSAQPFNIKCSRASTDFQQKSQITGTFANVVTTPGVTSPRDYSAKVSGTGVVSNEIGDLISGNCTTGSGTTTCTFAPTFTAVNCAVSPITANSYAMTISSLSTTAISTRNVLTTTGALSATDYSIICMGY